MQEIISFLTLTVFILFVIGIINPLKISKWSGRDIGRKEIILGCLGCFFVLAVFSGEGAKRNVIDDFNKNKPVITNEDKKQDEIDVPIDEVDNSIEKSDIVEFAVEDTIVAEQNIAVESKENVVEVEYYKVTRVVDGDTIELENGQKVRYIGINTPESVSTRQSLQCFGIEASNKNKELVQGKMVRLEKDVSETDRYGRLLRYVYLKDGTFVNEYLVKEGYASAYRYPPDVKYADLFRNREAEAREAVRGLWNPDNCAIAEEENVVIEEEQPVVTIRTGHTWYTSSHYSAQFYYCDTDDAWKELSPKYLKSFASPEELLQDYPNRVLHEDC